jgi:hypothetical protein
MSFENGPYVTAACFCESVLEEKTGVLTLVRIIDTVTHSGFGPTPPKDMPAFAYNFLLAVMLKSGEAHGRYDLRVVPQQPDGSTKDEITFTFHFEGEEKGQNVVAQINYQFALEGLYWFRVFLEEEFLTAIPLRVRYNRIIAGPGFG